MYPLAGFTASWRFTPILVPGQQLGQYTVLSKIGEGGMGSVYLAEQPSIHRRVVVKVLSTGLAGDPGMLQRFRREVDIIARLEHPHIVPVYDYGEVEGDPYIVMRYMAGGSLLDRLHRHSIGRPELLIVLEQVAEALDYSHDHEVVHRDLKPANILLDERSNAYLGDFGLAKTLEGTGDLTQTGTVIGSPAYMSPEQARGDRLDARSDVYSFAVMAYQALSGEHPFSATTPMEYLQAHLSEPPRPILAVTPDLPREVDAVFGSALAKEREQRPARTGEFMKNLRAALAGAEFVGSVSRTRPPPTAAIGQVPTRAAATRAQGPVPSPIARKPGRGLALPLAGVAVLGGGIVLVAAIAIALLVFRDQLFGPSASIYPVGSSPRGMVYDGRSIWVANVFDGTLTKLVAEGCDASPDPCGAALGTYPVDALPLGLAFDGEDVWVASGLTGRLVRLAPETGEATAEIELGTAATGLLSTPEAFWVLHAVAKSVTRISADGMDVRDLDLGFEPSALAHDGRSIWISGAADQILVKIDPSTGQIVDSFALPVGLTALVAEGSRLWAIVLDAASVVRLSPDLISTDATVPVEGEPSALLYDGARIWVAAPRTNQVLAIDPATAQADLSISVEGGPYGLAWAPCALGCGDLWTSNESAGTVARIRIQD